MPDLMNHEDNHLYAEVLAWLNRNMTSTFQRDNATAIAAALDTTNKQLTKPPTASLLSAEFAFFQTLLQKTDPEQLQWRNFQIFIYEKLQERELKHQQIMSQLKTHDWQIITKALAAFGRRSPA